MSQFWRRLRVAVNTVSTAASRSWCHSRARRLLTGHGPTARRRQSIRREMRSRAAGAPTAAQLAMMKARAAAIDELLASGEAMDREQE